MNAKNLGASGKSSSIGKMSIMTKYKQKSSPKKNHENTSFKIKEELLHDGTDLLDLMNTSLKENELYDMSNLQISPIRNQS